MTNSKTDAPQTNNQGADNQKKSSSQQSEDPNQDPAVQNNSKAGTYQDYSKPTFTTTPGMRLIFFFSSQSLQSIELDKSIKSSQIPAGVTIFKADFGTKDDLRNKYGVTLQGTVVKVKEDGSLDKKFTLDDKSYTLSLHDALPI